MLPLNASTGRSGVWRINLLYGDRAGYIGQTQIQQYGVEGVFCQRFHRSVEARYVVNLEFLQPGILAKHELQLPGIGQVVFHQQ
jgi:hypothetical protein